MDSIIFINVCIKNFSKRHENCRVLGNIPLVISDKCVKYTSEDEVESMSPKTRKRYRDAMHQRKRQQELVSSDSRKE